MLSVGDCAVEGLGLLTKTRMQLARSGAVLESKGFTFGFPVGDGVEGLGSGERLGRAFRGGGLFGSQCPLRPRRLGCRRLRSRGQVGRGERCIGR